MSQGFIALHRGENAETLLAKYPNAFLLLTQIALRAQWKDNLITGVKAGEAFLGDYQSAGIKTEKAYRYAKTVLARCGLASFDGANDGTVATLIGTSIFSTTVPDRGEQGADEGRLPTRIQGNKDTKKTIRPPAPKGKVMIYSMMILEANKRRRRQRIDACPKTGSE